jgi:hypothetical protein
MALFLGSVLPVYADEPGNPDGVIDSRDPETHDLHHDAYKQWKDAEGESCCNEQDCHPVNSRPLKDSTGNLIGYEIEIIIDAGRGKMFDEWYPIPFFVPNDTTGGMMPNPLIRPHTPPDFSAHACFWIQWVENIPKARFRCVIFPFNS